MIVTVTILKIISSELKSCIAHILPTSPQKYLIVVEVEAILVEEGAEEVVAPAQSDSHCAEVGKRSQDLVHALLVLKFL